MKVKLTLDFPEEAREAIARDAGLRLPAQWNRLKEWADSTFAREIKRVISKHILAKED